MLLFGRDKFFDTYRPFHHGATQGPLTLRQVTGLNFLLEQIEADDTWQLTEEIAYFLATIFWETGATFEPIEERRAREGTTAWRRQERYWPSGYYGRGYVQLTWKTNYAKAGRALLVDLVNKPALASDPLLAYEIASRGMREGWFTGKKLGDFIDSHAADYLNARRVVNGTDRAEKIAGIAREIEKTLRGSLIDKPEVTQPTTPEVTLPEVTEPIIIRPPLLPEPYPVSSGADLGLMIDLVLNSPRVKRAVSAVITERLNGIRINSVFGSMRGMRLNNFNDEGINDMGGIKGALRSKTLWAFVLLYGSTAIPQLRNLNPDDLSQLGTLAFETAMVAWGMYSRVFAKTQITGMTTPTTNPTDDRSARPL